MYKQLLYFCERIFFPLGETLLIPSQMVNYLAGKAVAYGWLPSNCLTEHSSNLGILLRRSRGRYISCPENIDSELLAAAIRLNVGVLATIRLGMLQPIISGMYDGQTGLVMKGGYQLQAVESLAAVTSASVKKFQYGAILKKEGVLLVWQDEARDILLHAQRMENKILSYIWGRRSQPSLPSLSPFNGSTPQHDSPSASLLSYPMNQEKGPSTGMDHDDNKSDDGLEDHVPYAIESINRPIMLHSAIFVGLGICLALVLVYGLSVGQLVSECLLDQNYARLSLIAVCPFLLFAGMFFFQVIFGDLWQIVGPIGGLKENSRTYSCIKPNLHQAYALGFHPPHITIQMPVYKEGMDTVIIPTVRSLQAAISFYESRGGTASIFINDDGMRMISEEEAQARRDFYQDNDIGWVSRPMDGAEGFVRRGKFKKASNMNYALNISQLVEAYLQEAVIAKCAEDPELRDTNELLLEEHELDELVGQCLDRVLRENPEAMAAGNIRIGEFILIVDSDTRVVSFFPASHCLYYGTL